MGRVTAVVALICVACASAPSPVAPPPAAARAIFRVVARHPGVGPTGTLRGKVLEIGSGAPLLLATIFATNYQQVHTGEFSREAGQFEIGGLPPGDYDLTAIYGRTTVPLTVRVDAGATVELVARLDTSGNEPLRLYCPPPPIEFATRQGRVFGRGVMRNIPWRGRTSLTFVDEAAGTIGSDTEAAER